MQCFIWFMATAGLWSIAVVASSRPIISISRATPLRRGYEEKDTALGFYSYGYSDENAARAEYTTYDGSSRGFYSYVDANGKLQTVKYEAGGGQGFKAEASNLPKAPIDDNKPPLPVTDTAEVKDARQAHLSAIQKARDQEQREQSTLEEQRQAQRQEQRQEQRQDEQPLSDEDADILERVRAELTSMLEQRQRGQENRNSDEANNEAAAENNGEIRDRNRDQDQDQGRRPEQRLQLTNDDNDLRMRTVYSLTDLSSSRYLKLSDLQDRLTSDSRELRVPVSAYYAYASPSAKYSVTTPTELRTLRPVALSRSLLLSKRN